ncbi:MAG: 50S ribosomal protein L4 [Candidatus Riflebacteria bacterium]|nr:50S ribosomal protein L4 [Candidatus Riflebacteria bacterium]
MELKKWNMQGGQTGTVSVEESVFGLNEDVATESNNLRPVSEQTIIDVVKAQLNNERQGTNNTKTRAEVAGGGRKPFRQKGTGRARQGSIRSPLMPGGGATFGPRPKCYDHRPPKKMVDRAMCGILTDLASEDRIRVVETLSFADGKTKSVNALLKSFQLEKALFVVTEVEETAVRATRNLSNVKIVTPRKVNAVDLLKFCPVYTTTKLNRKPGSKKNQTMEVVRKGGLVITESALKILQSKAAGMFDCEMDDYHPTCTCCHQEAK